MTEALTISSEMKAMAVAVLQTALAPIAGCLLVAVFTLEASAQEPTKTTRTFTVEVTVSADEEVKGEITSYLNRELRELGDVTIADDGAQFKIGVVALTNIVGGSRTGQTLSVVIYHKLDPDGHLKRALNACGGAPPIVAATIELYLPLLESAYTVDNHVAYIGPTDVLKEYCSKIVAEFDTAQLEPKRRVTRMFEDAMRKPEGTGK